MKGRIKDKLAESCDRVWKAFMKFGPVDDGRPEGDEFDSALIAMRQEYKAFKIQVRGERAALVSIVNALNANPEPIHYKVREAIQQGRKAIQEWDLFDSEAES